MSHLQDRVVMVTGAGSGFGRLLVQGCVARGAKAVAVDLDPAAAEETVAGLADGSALAVGADVTVLADVREAAAAAVDAFGRIDVLVNNAGTMPLAFWADHDQAAEAWSRCIDVNIKGVMHGISAVYDHMIEQGRGHVVNISSIYGNHAVPGSAVYTASKAAVNLLSDTLRQEAHGRIKVTVVRPTGVFGTGLGGTVVNRRAMAGIVGTNYEAYRDAAQGWLKGELPAPMLDADEMAYWSISPQDLVDQILYTIDQPWGITIGDITVRASGEHYIL
ncbi:MAG: SDR family oxidoreductase [Acidimicrobiales bacterium]